MSAPTVELMTEQRALVVGGATGQIVWLTLAEYRIYKRLAQEPGQVINHEDLHVAFYDQAPRAESNCLQVIVSRLRKKLAGAGAEHKILTARNVGYRLVEGGTA